MAWIGFIKFPDPVQYLIENKVAKLCKSSKEEDWLECVAGLRKFKHYIWNAPVDEKPKLFPSNLWTFVHHAAFHKAPLSILQILNVDKYPLSLPDGEGRQAIDHVDHSMPDDYKALLQPKFKYDVLPLELKLIQVNFNAIIIDRIEALIEKYELVLPVLSVLLEDICKYDEMYFDVPGMYGGFTYWFEFDKETKEIIGLWSRSSSRVVANSEQLHKCTADGWSLIKSGS